MAYAGASNPPSPAGSNPASPTTPYVYAVECDEPGWRKKPKLYSDLGLAATAMYQMMEEDYEKKKFALSINESMWFMWLRTWYISVRGINDYEPGQSEVEECNEIQERVRGRFRHIAESTAYHIGDIRKTNAQ